VFKEGSAVTLLKSLKDFANTLGCDCHWIFPLCCGLAEVTGGIAANYPSAAFDYATTMPRLPADGGGGGRRILLRGAGFLAALAEAAVTTDCLLG
jgi:hypothetical protein